jgi:Na+/proline symporter
VPAEKDAKKAAYLFGLMYLITPVFWMIPPIVFRTLNPDVSDTEQAYVLACQFVLPAGMMGLMVAAMASATASMATTRLNVFAGAFTTEVYHRKINQNASEKQLVTVGRMVTIALGCIVIAGALLIPKYGYTGFILDINTLLYGPMLMPTIWGLFSRKIGLKAIWATVLIGFFAAYLIKFALAGDGILTKVELLRPLVDWLADHAQIVNRTAGLVIPFFILLLLELFGRREHPGWQRIKNIQKDLEDLPQVKSSSLPGKMVAICLASLAVMMAVLSVINRESTSILLAAAIFLMAIAWTVHRFNRTKT